jgi:hypothetical protein
MVEKFLLVLSSIILVWYAWTCLSCWSHNSDLRVKYGLRGPASVKSWLIFSAVASLAYVITYAFWG